jgi:hypothetical protein
MFASCEALHFPCCTCLRLVRRCILFYTCLRPVRRCILFFIACLHFLSGHLCEADCWFISSFVKLTTTPLSLSLPCETSTDEGLVRAAHRAPFRGGASASRPAARVRNDLRIGPCSISERAVIRQESSSASSFDICHLVAIPPERRDCA